MKKKVGLVLLAMLVWLMLAGCGSQGAVLNNQGPVPEQIAIKGGYPEEEKFVQDFIKILFARTYPYTGMSLEVIDQVDKDQELLSKIRLENVGEKAKNYSFKQELTILEWVRPLLRFDGVAYETDSKSKVVGDINTQSYKTAISEAVTFVTVRGDVTGLKTKQTGGSMKFKADFKAEVKEFKDGYKITSFSWGNIEKLGLE